MAVKILLVDDEELFVQALSERLKTRDFKVETANSGREALDKAKETTFDVIILDMAMPGMDGMETQQELLKTNPDLQIIFLTGHATLEKGIDAVKQGAFDFIAKPVEFEKLLEKLDAAQNKKKNLDMKKSEQDIKNLMKKKGW